MAEYDERSSAYHDPVRDAAAGEPRYRDPAATAYRDSAAYDDAPRHRRHVGVGHKNILDWLAILLLIVGGLNWGLVGLFGFDIVAAIFGSGTPTARAIYIAVGVAAIWGFALMRLGPARHD